MTDVFNKSFFSNKKVLTAYLELTEDPDLAVTKCRKSQQCSCILGLMIFAIGIGIYYFVGTHTLVFAFVFLGGLAVGMSFTAAQGAATAHIASRCLDTDKIRQQLSEIESEEGDDDSSG